MCYPPRGSKNQHDVARVVMSIVNINMSKFSNHGERGNAMPDWKLKKIDIDIHDNIAPIQLQEQ